MVENKDALEKPGIGRSTRVGGLLLSLDFHVLIQQMILFYTIILVGYLAYRTRFLRDEDVASLVFLLPKLFIPLLLFTSILNSTDDLSALGVVFLGLALGHALMIGLGYVTGRLFHLKNPTLGVHTAAVGFQNDGLMGDPLWLAIFPARAGLAIVAVSILYAVTQWTVAYPLTALRGSGYHFRLRNCITPPLVSVLASLAFLALDIHPSGVAWDALTGVGNCTKYLAMIYIGAAMAQKGFRRLLARPILFPSTLIKMLAGPLLVFLLLRGLGFLDETWMLMIVMMMAMPAPMTLCIQAAMNHSDEDYAIGSMMLSTLVSLATLPAVMYLAGVL